MTTMHNVGLSGCAWQTNTSAACPTIYGDVRRDHSTITGIRVGVTATSTSKQFNRAEVTADPDSVLVPRLFGEALYSGLDPSLVQRVAELHGTARAWALVYAD